MILFKIYFINNISVHINKLLNQFILAHVFRSVIHVKFIIYSLTWIVRFAELYPPIKEPASGAHIL